MEKYFFNMKKNVILYKDIVSNNISILFNFLTELSQKIKFCSFLLNCIQKLFWIFSTEKIIFSNKIKKTKVFKTMTYF